MNTTRFVTIVVAPRVGRSTAAWRCRIVPSRAMPAHQIADAIVISVTVSLALMQALAVGRACRVSLVDERDPFSGSGAALIKVKVAERLQRAIQAKTVTLLVGE